MQGRDNAAAIGLTEQVDWLESPLSRQNLTAAPQKHVSA